MPVLQRISLTLILIAILGGCSSLPEGIDHPTEPQTFPSSSVLSVLAADYQPESVEQGTTAVSLQESGWDALAQRLALVESAEHTIDIQYYIWNSDESGSYLASRLL
ncbi:phospholipase D family protein, partial [Vibrio cyclitrophicus]